MPGLFDSKRLLLHYFGFHAVMTSAERRLSRFSFCHSEPPACIELLPETAIDFDFASLDWHSVPSYWPSWDLRPC